MGESLIVMIAFFFFFKDFLHNLTEDNIKNNDFHPTANKAINLKNVLRFPLFYFFALVFSKEQTAFEPPFLLINNLESKLLGLFSPTTGKTVTIMKGSDFKFYDEIVNENNFGAVEENLKSKIRE